MLKNRFIVMSHGRTGSAMFCNLLSQHKHIKCYHEVFHNDENSRDTVNSSLYKDDENASKFLEERVFMWPNETGKRNIGFKLFFFHARRDKNSYLLWENIKRDKDIKIIFLLRKNLFDAFVSNYRARKSNIWQLSNKHDRNAVDKSIDKYNKPINVPVWECSNYMEGIVAGRAWMLSNFPKHETLTIYYEDLVRDMECTIRRSFHFLGEDYVDVKMSNKKLNLMPHEIGIKNYEEIKKHFQYSIYRSYFVGGGDDVVT